LPLHAIVITGLLLMLSSMRFNSRMSSTAVTRRDSSQDSHAFLSDTPVFGDVNTQRLVSAKDVSGIFFHVPAGTQGRPRAMYHRFTNVQLKGGHLNFFAGGADAQPAVDHWVDVTIGNATLPIAPSYMLLRDGPTGEQMRVLSVRHLPRSMDPKKDCPAGWLEDPAVLLHVRRSTSVWHTLIEGLAPTFQTLRELGYLPLVEVGVDSDVKESAAAPERCPRVVDPSTGSVIDGPDCGALPVVLPSSCAKKSVEDPWCRYGLLAAPNATRAVLLILNEGTLESPLAALYSAMAKKMREFRDLEGVCFSSLTVGRSATLDYFKPPPGNKGEMVRAAAKGAVSAFYGVLFSSFLHCRILVLDMSLTTILSTFWFSFPPHRRCEPVPPSPSIDSSVASRSGWQSPVFSPVRISS
jgi:hypothetical protein